MSALGSAEVTRLRYHSNGRFSGIHFRPALTAKRGVDNPLRRFPVDADTVITGFARDAIPYLEEGDELVLVASECAGDGDARKLVVERISRR
jgi:hypothetical protein